MDTEFHYYITGIVARAAGFSEEDARVIAYASEYVDENDRTVWVRKKGQKRKEDGFSNYISQTMNILKPKDALMRIYPIFHFVPGEPDAETARRRDGRMHRLNTTPAGEHATHLFDEAFKALEDTRLYRIGIATHMFADTWAHQNFVGWYDSHNHIGLDIKPNIGHADAEHHPDWPGHRWIDTRLVDGDADNTVRFLAAAQAIYRRYCEYLRGNFSEQDRDNWKELAQRLRGAMGRPFTGANNYYREERMAVYLEIAPWLDGQYNEALWFDDAIETVNEWFTSDGDLSIFEDEYYWREDRDFLTTDWYRFQVAVKDHERAALNELKSVFGEMDVDVSRA